MCVRLASLSGQFGFGLSRLCAGLRLAAIAPLASRLDGIDTVHHVLEYVLCWSASAASGGQKASEISSFAGVCATQLAWLEPELPRAYSKPHGCGRKFSTLCDWTNRAGQLYNGTPLLLDQ